MITQVIWADVNNRELDTVYARTGDEEIREIRFIICRNDPPEKVEIPAGVSGQFRMIKSSGNFVVRDMTKTALEDGTVIFTVAVSDQMVNVQGTGYYDIRLSGGGYLYTASGSFIVDTPVISSSVLEDVSEVNGLVFPDDFITTEDHVAIIDDDTISTDSTWSSNKINEEIEAHAGGDVSKTVSGNPITFTDGAAAPLVKCVTQITGSQDLHGYDKPWVGGAGNNKLPLVLSDIKAANTTGIWSGNVYTISGATFTVNADNGGNVISIIGKGNGSAGNALSLPFTLSAGSYILSSGFEEMNGTNDTFLQSGGVTIARGNSGSPGQNFTLSQDSSCNWLFRVASAVNHTCTPMIRLATEADSTFTTYSNICPITAYTEGEIEVSDGDGNTTTHTATFSNSIYQGNADFVGGEAEAEWVKVVFDGSSDESWYQHNTYNTQFGINVDGLYLYIDFEGQGYTNDLISNYYDCLYSPATTRANGTLSCYEGTFGNQQGGKWFALRDDRFTSLSDFKTWLASNPLEIAYKRITKTDTITPTNLPIKSLFGYNHIESSTGDMEVEYIPQRFQPLIDSIKQL